MAFFKSRRRLAKDEKIRDLKQRITQRAALRPARAPRGIDPRLLAEFEDKFFGTVITPQDRAYDAARRESNPRFQASPSLIGYCETFDDVRQCLALARKTGLRAVCRSGGHSTGGFSVRDDGIVIDLSRVDHIHVDPRRKVAVVGPGTNFGRLNRMLDFYHLHVPGGECEDVCIGGYMQGGGYGFTAREFGMNCDNVVSALVMLANGKIVEASRRKNRDLFWAVRGGTGNNFGVLLEVRYRLHSLEPGSLWGFGLSWTLDEAYAPKVLETLQAEYMKSGAPAQLGYQLVMVPCGTNGPSVLLMRGMYHGRNPDKEGRKLLAPLLKIGHPTWDIDRVDSYSVLNRYLVEYPFDLPPVPPDTDVYTIMEDKQSGIIDVMLDQDDWRKIIDQFNKRAKPYNMAAIEPYGGAINRHRPSYNAFIHRRAHMDFFVDTFWTAPSEEKAARGWLDDFMALTNGYFKHDHCYQNYPRVGLANYRWMYWGEAFPTLLRLKEKYDSDKFFWFPQCIQPAPKGAGRGVQRATSASRFTDRSITYERF